MRNLIIIYFSRTTDFVCVVREGGGGGIFTICSISDLARIGL